MDDRLQENIGWSSDSTFISARLSISWNAKNTLTR